MPKISKITTQKKSNHRFNIFLTENDKEYYGFSVDEDVLITYHLHKGLSLTPELIKKIQELDASYKVYTLSIRYLSYRMRSELELIEYLQKKEVEDTYIDEVIHRLKLEGLLDDAAFSEALVRTRIQTSAKGSQLIKKELVEKGIKNSLIEETLKQFTFEIQYEKVEKLARKKLNSSTKKSYRQQVDALKQTLLQKGFTFDVISEVVNNIEIDRDENDEYNAIVFQGEKLVSKYQKKESEFALKQKVKAGLYQKGFPADLINRFIDEYLNQAY